MTPEFHLPALGIRVEHVDQPVKGLLTTDGDRQYIAKGLMLTEELLGLLRVATDRGLTKLWVDNHPGDKWLKIAGREGERYRGGTGNISLAEHRARTDAKLGFGWVVAFDRDLRRNSTVAFQSRFKQQLESAGLVSPSKSQNDNPYVPVQNFEEALDLIGFGSIRGETRADLMTPTSDSDLLRRRADELLRRGSLTEPPQGNPNPKRTAAGGGGKSSIERLPDVVTWTLQRAILLGSKCELCGQPAPFERPNLGPFFEVHHVKFLASLGPDTIENTAALCPNCHRAAHHSPDRVNIAAKLRAHRAAHK